MDELGDIQSIQGETMSQTWLYCCSGNEWNPDRIWLVEDVSGDFSQGEILRLRIKLSVTVSCA